MLHVNQDSRPQYTPGPGGEHRFFQLPGESSYTPADLIRHHIAQLKEIPANLRDDYFRATLQLNGPRLVLGQRVRLPPVAEFIKAQLAAGRGAGAQTDADAFVHQTPGAAPRKVAPQQALNQPNGLSPLKSAVGNRPLDRLSPEQIQEREAQLVEGFSTYGGDKTAGADLVFKSLHGLNRRDQQLLISRYNQQAIRAGKEGFWTVVDRMSERQYAQIKAYIRNDSGILEPHDRLYLAMKGWLTSDEEVKRVLLSLGGDITELEQTVDNYKRCYGETLIGALDGDFDGADFQFVKMLATRKGRLTRVHFDAFELYRRVGWVQDDRSGVAAILEGRTKAEIRQLEVAFRDLFPNEKPLFDYLDWAFDGQEYERLQILRKGDTKTRQDKARYLALTASLHVNAYTDWSEFVRTTASMIDPTGKTGPTFSEVVKEYRSVCGPDRSGLLDALKLKYGRSDQAHLGYIEHLKNNRPVRGHAVVKATQLYSMTVGKTGTDEEGFCNLLATMGPKQLAEVKSTFAALYDVSLEQVVKGEFETWSISDQLWRARALAHVDHGVLTADETWRFVKGGVMENHHLIAALRRLDSKRRLELIDKVKADRSAFGRLDSRTRRAVESLRALAVGGREALLVEMQKQLKGEFADTGAIANWLADTFGFTGEELRERAREFVHAFQVAQQHKPARQDDLKRVLETYKAFAATIEAHQQEVDGIGDAAKETAAVAAAVAVGFVTGGTGWAALGWISAAELGTRVVVGKAIDGERYSLDEFGSDAFLSALSAIPVERFFKAKWILPGLGAKRMKRLLGAVGNDAKRLESLLGAVGNDAKRLESLLGAVGNDAKRLESLLGAVGNDVRLLERLLGKVPNTGLLERLLSAFPATELDSILGQINQPAHLGLMLDHIGVETSTKMVGQWSTNGKLSKLEVFLQHLAQGIGGPLAETAPLRTGSVVIDTQVALALRKKATDAASMHAGETAMDRTVSGLPQGTDLRFANVTVGEAGDLADISARGFPLQASRASKEYRDLVAELEKHNVGTKKGHADRAIIADAFFAKCDPGVTPALLTADKNVINSLARRANIDPNALGGQTVAQKFKGGFQVTINGRAIRVLPIATK